MGGPRGRGGREGRTNMQTERHSETGIDRPRGKARSSKEAVAFMPPFSSPSSFLLLLPLLLLLSQLPSAAPGTASDQGSMDLSEQMKDIIWTVNSHGQRIALREGDCPGGVALREYGIVQPDLVVLLKALLRRGDVVAHAGSGNGAVSLSIAHIIGKEGIVAAFESDSLPLSMTLSSISPNADMAHVFVSRTRVALPVESSKDKVWGVSPPCMGGYVGDTADPQLMGTPLDALIRDQKTNLLLLSLPPEQVQGVLAGCERLLNASHRDDAPVIIFTGDYDPQAGVLEPQTLLNLLLLSQTHNLETYLHIGQHAHALARAHTHTPPPLHIVAAHKDHPRLVEFRRILQQGQGTLQEASSPHKGKSPLAGGVSPLGTGGVLRVLKDTPHYELHAVFKRMFISLVERVERWGMNTRMMFRRVTHNFPLGVRSNLGGVVKFSEGGRRQDEARRRIAQMQNPTHCADANFLVLRYVNGELAGHGSFFGHLATALGYAFVTGRTLLVDEQTSWPFKDGCVQDGVCARELGFMGTYFQPLSHCSMPVLRAGEAHAELTEADLNEKVVYVSDDAVLPKFRTIIPNDFVREGEAPDESMLLLWFSTVMSYALRPSAFLQTKIDTFRARLPARYIGMHIRRGHKWVETAALPLEAYIHAASNISATLQIFDVLVVTEDPTVEAVLRSLNPPHASAPTQAAALTYHFTPHVRHGYRVSIPQGIRMGLLQASAENEVSLVNLYLMQQAEACIGAFSSGYSKRSLEMQVGRRGEIPLYVSLDQLWGP